MRRELIIEAEGNHGCRVGEQGVLMQNPSTGPLPAPAGSTDCCPEVRKATPDEYELVNPRKQSNFILGELVSGGELSFLIENLPKTAPQTGCVGLWMFQQMMAHFGTRVNAIQGNWLGVASDNLSAINRLTAGGALTVEEAAKQTWTGMRAKDYGYNQVEVVGTPAGTPGHYTRVQVLFKK